MVSKSSETTTSRAVTFAIPERHPNTALQARSSASTGTQATADGMQFIRQAIQGIGMSQEATEIVMSSWRKATQKQYKGYIERWLKFCSENDFNCRSPQISEVIDYLVTLFESGLGYSCVNTARSALSLQSGNPLGSHPLVVRFMKGVFELRPSLPRYTSTWDVNIVLTYLKSLSLNAHLSLKDLTYKLACLLVILSGQRVQTIHLLDTQHMLVQENKIIFQVKELVKQSKPGRHVDDLEFVAYTPDERLCVVSCLHEYIKRTSVIRGQETQLFISFVKPHLAISKDTLSRWVKTVLCNAGVDMNMFKSHSTRSASTSAATRLGVNMQTIMRTAGWTNAQYD
jgi:hypothetical protein